MQLFSKATLSRLVKINRKSLPRLSRSFADGVKTSIGTQQSTKKYYQDVKDFGQFEQERRKYLSLEDQ